MPHIQISSCLAALQRRHAATRIVLLQAPAGFGKTTAAAWWAEQLGNPAIWLRLESYPSLQDVQPMLQALAAAACSRAGAPELSGTLTPDDVLTVMRTHYAAGLTVVIDDFHMARHADWETVLQRLAEADIPLCLLIASRTTPEMPLWARWQVQQQAVLASDRELALGAADIQAWFNVSADDAAGIHQQTAGWPFALVLYGEARRRGLTLTDWNDDTTIVDYLQGELLRTYPAETVQCMRIMALLDRFDADDCRALDLPAADATLRLLRRDHVFLRLQDGQYSFHALARKLLADGLGESERQAWHRRIAQRRWEQEDDACLGHYIAAGAYRDAARAATWFDLTLWREAALHQPILTHWFSQLPAEKLGRDSWFQLLACNIWHGASEAAASLDRLPSIARQFRAERDDLGQLVVACIAIHLNSDFGRLDDLERLAADVVTARRRIPESASIQLVALYALLNVYGIWLPDYQRMAACLQELAQFPSGPVRGPASRCRESLIACSAYVKHGSVRDVQRYWRLAVPLLSQAPECLWQLLQVQAIVGLTVTLDPPVPLEPHQALFQGPDDGRAIGWLWPCLAALDAWGRQDEAAACAWSQALAAAMRERPSPGWNGSKLHVLGRWGLALIRQGDVAAGLAVFAEHDGLPAGHFVRCEWQLHHAKAWALAGRSDRAAELAESARAMGERWQFGLLAVLARQLLAELGHLPPLIDDWLAIQLNGLQDVIERHYADWWPQVEGPPASPQVQIRTLGGLEVMVDGSPVVWKRTNSKLVLLDLLLHPAGSSGADMEARYWPGAGNSSLRNDIQALRTALEPAQAPKDSRCVRYGESRYVWALHPAHVEWDAARFAALARHALASTDPEVGRGLAREALSQYQGDFCPEFQAYADIAARQAELRDLRERLQAMVTAVRAER